MEYLTLEDIHKQCIIDSSFIEDDQYLTTLGTACEDYLESFLDASLGDIAVDNCGNLPKNLYLCLLMLVDYFYDNRGSNSTNDLPPAFYVLSKTYVKYNIA